VIFLRFKDFGGKRIGLIKGENIDADILDEEARRSLGRVHKNEVVILHP
jgi:cell division protein FtsB